MRFKETLHGSSALEPLDLSLMPPNTQMRVLGAIAFAQSSRSVSVAEAKALKRSAIRAQTIRNDDLWLDVSILQQPAQ